MERKLFLGANTPDGFKGFSDEIVKMYDLKKLYILKGGSGVGKSTFIKKFASAFSGNITYFHCSQDPKSLDGAVIEDLGIAIIDGTAPHISDPKYPGIIDEIINLGQFIDSAKVTATREQIDEITAAKRENFEKAYLHLAKARELHLQLESFYKNTVDFKQVDKLLSKILKSLGIGLY